MLFIFSALVLLAWNQAHTNCVTYPQELLFQSWWRSKSIERDPSNRGYLKKAVKMGVVVVGMMLLQTPV